MDHHEAVANLKALALELARSPSKREFCSRFAGGHYVAAKHGFATLLKQAGLDTYSERRGKVKIDSSVWEKDLSTHLEARRPAEKRERVPWPKIAVISDIHWPWANERVLEAFYAFIEEARPEYVIINGDAWDMYAHGKFPRSHNTFSPREEQESARKQNAQFWERVQKLLPAAKCYQLMGNHDVRPLKRILEVYPAAEDWIEKALKESFTFPGVTTIFDAREELHLGNICIFHGYRAQLGSHRDFTLMNCVNGHSHQGGAVFKTIRGEVLWELNSGFAGDATGKGLTYTPQRIVNWTPGFGFIDEHGPRFIPVY